VAQDLESLDVTAELASWLDEDDESVPVVLTAGSGKTSAVLMALRDALVRLSRLEELAQRAELDPESLLDVMAAELTRGPVSDSSASAFSAHERSVLRAANVDLSGPPPSASPAATTASAYARMLGEALTVDECARRLGVTSGRVRQRVNERTVHAVRSRARGEWRLPRWQFDDHGVVSGLEAVLPGLAESLHPLAVEHFMTSAVPDLEVNGAILSPVQWLQSGGDPQAVVELAAALPAAS
jgi:excisionase family DNA binding protein